MRSCWHGFTQSCFYTEELYTEELYTEDLLHREARIQGGLYTQNLYTEKLLSSLDAEKLAHKEAFTHRRVYGGFAHGCVYTQKPPHTEALRRVAFTQRSLDTKLQKGVLHTETFTDTDAYTHRKFYTQKHLRRTETFTLSSFYTQEHFHKKPLHREVFPHRGFRARKLLHRKAFTHRTFYTEKLLSPRSLIQRSFYAQTRLHREAPLALTHRSFYTQKFLHKKAFTQKL